MASSCPLSGLPDYIILEMVIRYHFFHTISRPDILHALFLNRDKQFACYCYNLKKSEIVSAEDGFRMSVHKCHGGTLKWLAKVFSLPPHIGRKVWRVTGCHLPTQYNDRDGVWKKFVKEGHFYKFLEPYYGPQEGYLPDPSSNEILCRKSRNSSYCLCFDCLSYYYHIGTDTQRRDGSVLPPLTFVQTKKLMERTMMVLRLQLQEANQERQSAEVLLALSRATATAEKDARALRSMENLMK